MFMARPGSNFCLWNLQGWHHTIGTEKDYYQMGRGVDDPPREWILAVEKAHVRRRMSASSPTSFPERGKWLLRGGKCHIQNHTARGWKSQVENPGS